MCPLESSMCGENFSSKHVDLQSKLWVWLCKKGIKWYNTVRYSGTVNNKVGLLTLQNHNQATFMVQPLQISVVRWCPSIEVTPALDGRKPSLPEEGTHLLPGDSLDLPPGNVLEFAIENGQPEIVHLPIKNGDFQWLCFSLPGLLPVLWNAVDFTSELSQLGREAPLPESSGTFCQSLVLRSLAQVYLPSFQNSHLSSPGPEKKPPGLLLGEEICFAKKKRQGAFQRGIRGIRIYEWFIMENTIRIDDLRTILGNPHVFVD